jgi:hypothetical protein
VDDSTANNSKIPDVETPSKDRDVWVAAGLGLIALLAFFFSIKATQQHFDYTARIASALLEGDIGLEKPAPSWLNEMVPLNGHYYSVFPLGAVLSMLPVAILQKIHVLKDFPGRALAALIAALSVWFLFRLSILGTKSLAKRILFSVVPIFGTWTWCNLGFGGAWQIALGLALLGEIGALYFVLVDSRPVIAGAFFALAVGNRTEVVLCLPVFLYLLHKRSVTKVKGPKSIPQPSRDTSRRLMIYFLIVPVALGFFTALYNYARFNSFFDFGYAHIPNVMKEPWYRHGLFSFHAIPWNVHKMLFEGFRDAPSFPYISFFPFGCSIFLASPFLVLIFREGGLHKMPVWTAIGLLTLALWMHGNPGGWEFSYRYAMVLLPWMFLLMIGNGPPKLSVIEASLFVVSIAINTIATYQFLWTNQIHP